MHLLLYQWTIVASDAAENYGIYNSEDLQILLTHHFGGLIRSYTIVLDVIDQGQDQESRRTRWTITWSLLP